MLVVAATNTAHHVLVPVVKLVAGFVGNAKHLTYHANGELIRKCFTQLHGVLACCRVVFGHARCRVKPFINHLIGKFANGTNALGESSTYKVATIEVAAAAVFNTAEFKLCVAENVI